jgi:hypothetical protein
LTDVVAIDWSGVKSGGATHIWRAHVRAGAVRELANGLDRDALVRHVIGLKDACPEGLVVGFDFSFSLPAWFLRQRGHAGAADLWHEVARQGEAWLADLPPPFWGKAGTTAPDRDLRFRATEVTATAGGVRAKSTFQVNGPGTVGTGSLRGMALLLQLQRAGFSIWPFDPPSPWTVVEIYPRLLTGAVVKGVPAARLDYLRRSPWPLADHDLLAAAASEDAFDALISALAMDRHVAQLRALTPTTDPTERLEGRIWAPHNIGS